VAGCWVVTVPLACPLQAVALWSIDLDQHLDPIARTSLSADEQARARRFRFARDRYRFEVGRVAVRELLALQLGCAPSAVALSSAGQGKPVLADAALGLHFNLSHSAGVGLVAITRAAVVGVDVEQRRDVSDAGLLAREHFTVDELAEFETLPAADRGAAFLRGWTRKEACLKAWATGLGLSARCIETGLGPEPRIVAAPAPDLGGPVRLVSLSWPHNGACEAAVALGTAGGSRRT
jgi:4'-phosphopantetheinyl transferase